MVTPLGDMVMPDQQEVGEQVQSMETEGQKIVSHDLKVEEIRSELEDFDYQQPPPDIKQNLETRPGFKDKLGGTYYGQWV